MIRTNDLMDPASWRGWNGKTKAYSVSFVSPYTLAPGTEAEHVCTVTNLPAGDIHTGCQAAGIVYSTYLDKFVTTLGCLDGTFKFATSDDLLVSAAHHVHRLGLSSLQLLQEWSDPQVFYSKKDMPTNTSKMVNALNYPTLMDPTAPAAFGDKVSAAVTGLSACEVFLTCCTGTGH
jgi:hypothetical protein